MKLTNSRFLTLCLLIAIAGRLTFELQAQTAWLPLPKSYVFHSRIHGDWLKVERYNSLNSQDQWDASYTAVRSNYRPIVKKQEDGTFLIEFTSELGKVDLP